MHYGIAALSFLAVRREKSETSEMVSQVLFGELYRVIEEADRWVRIETEFDRYGGWISRNQHAGLSDMAYQRIAEQPRTIVPGRFALADIPGTDVIFMIGAGSELPLWNKAHNTVKLGDRLMRISGFAGESHPDDAEHLLHTARQFLHTPYLWGGRSSFGYDCSGFVQTVYKIHHRALPRDAAQQAAFGKQVPSLQASEPGDLVFFTNGGQDIRHTGILISREEIIHCSGKVRIDRIDRTGIRNQEENDYSHTCFTIRRILRS